MLRFLLALLVSAPLCLHASPFASNLKGLKYLVVDVTGDASDLKKIGYSIDKLKKDLMTALAKKGVKVVSSGKEVPEGKKALPAELLLGTMVQGGFVSYALTLHVYEPMRMGKTDHLYVAWTSFVYGFSPKDKAKGLIKEQAEALAKDFGKDYNRVN